MENNNDDDDDDNVLPLITSRARQLMAVDVDVDGVGLQSR